MLARQVVSAEREHRRSLIAELVLAPRSRPPQRQPELDEHERDVGFDVRVPGPLDAESERAELVVRLVAQAEAPPTVARFLDDGPPGGAESAHGSTVVRPSGPGRDNGDRQGYIASMVAEASSPKVQFNVYLPAELVRELKHRAIDEGVSLSALVERIAAQYVSDSEGGSR